MKLKTDVARILEGGFVERATAGKLPSKQRREEINLFYAAAQASWRRGEDGEMIAKDLAHAVEWIIREGKGEDCDVTEEFDRLRNLR
jgi:hypothetical protein